MSSVVSVLKMISQLEAMLGTRDLSDWEDDFISDVVGRVGELGKTSVLSSWQVAKVEELWTKHFT